MPKLACEVAAAVALTGLISLVAGSPGQHRSFLLQQFIQRFFHAATDQFFDLPPGLLPCSVVQSSHTWFAVSFQNGVW